MLNVGTTWRYVVNFKALHILTSPPLQPKRDPQIFTVYENFSTLLQTFPLSCLSTFFSLDFRYFLSFLSLYLFVSFHLRTMKNYVLPLKQRRADSNCRYNTRAYVTVTL